MKIAFFPSSCLPFHAYTVNERPLGGIETSVIRLAEALSSFGHQVTVFTTISNPPLSSPLYVPQQMVYDLGPVDAFVAVRDWMPILLPVQAKKLMFWTGDSYDQVQSTGIGDKRVAEKIDRLLCVSDWHAQSLTSASGFPIEKTRVMRNGVKLSLFHGQEVRNPRRLIYSSTPYRGLELTPPLLLELRKKYPDLEFHIFTGSAVYAGAGGEDIIERHLTQIRAALDQIPGCIFHGNITQAKLAREFLKSSILFYPNIFEETSCITALEAQAAGCVTVTSSRGALPETVGNAGFLIPGQPGSPQYNQLFIEACEKILSDPTLFSKLSEQAKEQAKQSDWIEIAKRFVQIASE